MAKWQNAPVVEDQSWTDAPVVGDVRRAKPTYDERDRYIKTAGDVRAKSGQDLSKVDDVLSESGAIGFIESTREEFLRGAKGAQLVPFLGGAVEAAEQLQLLDAASRLKQDFDYTKPVRRGEMRPGAIGMTADVYRTRQQDEQLVADFIQRQIVSAERGYNWRGKAAKGLVQMPTWMIEFWLTGGLAKVGNEAVQNAGVKILRRYAQTHTGRVALKTAGWAGGAITRASLGLTPRIGAEMAQRQVNVQLLGAEQEGWATSFAKAWGDVVIEAASESAGESITGIPAKYLSKTRFGKAFVEKLGAAWVKATGGAKGEFVRRLAAKGGYSNLIGEVGEERLGTILRELTGVSNEGLLNALQEDARNIGSELVVLSVPSGAQIVAGQAAQRMNLASAKEMLSMLQPLRKADPDRAKIVEQELADRGVLPQPEQEAKDAEAVRAVQGPSDAQGTVEERGAEAGGPVVEQPPSEQPGGAAPQEIVPAAPAEGQEGPLYAEDKRRWEASEGGAREGTRPANAQDYRPAHFVRDEHGEAVDAFGQSLKPGDVIETATGDRWRVTDEGLLQGVSPETGQDLDGVIEHMYRSTRTGRGKGNVTREWGPTRSAQSLLARSRKVAPAAPAEAAAVETKPPVPPEPPATPAEQPVSGDAEKILREQLAKARKVVPQIKKEQREERRKRVGKAVPMAKKLATEPGVSVKQALGRSTGALAGPLTRYQGRYESIRDKLGENTIEAIRRRILNDETIPYFDTLRLLGTEYEDGLLDKLINGDALTLFQARFLGRTLGKDIGELAKKRVPLGDRMWLMILEALNIPRTSLASVDVSGVLRQGRALLHGEPELARQFVENYLRSFASEEFAKRLEADIKNDPYYDEAKQVGLELPEWGLVDADINELAEEFYAARLLQGVPGIRASERSFVNGLNWLRLAAYSRLVEHTEAVRGRELNFDEKRHLAKVINNLSGRTSLPRGLRELSPILNAAFFSPRFALSRLAPLWDVPLAAYRGLRSGEVPPELKLEIRALTSMIATNLAVLGLIGAVAGGDDDWDIEIDPRSADFGKIRYQNFRIDLWAGYVQPARFLYRFATGQKKTQAGEVREVDRWDMFREFVSTKQSPLASLLHDWWTGETMGGRPFGTPEKGGLLEKAPFPEKLSGALQETWNRLVPLVIQDAVDALVLQGIPEAVTGGLLAFGGAGVQTYEPSGFAEAKNKMNEIAQRELQTNWDNLKPNQQKRLRGTFSEIGDLEREARKKAYPMTKLDLGEQEKVRKRIHDALDPAVQQSLDEFRILTGIQRRILSDFWLNEDRYAAYEKMAVQEINHSVSRLVQSDSWPKMPPQTKEKVLQKMVNTARAKARAKLVTRINRDEL